MIIYALVETQVTCAGKRDGLTSIEFGVAQVHGPDDKGAAFLLYNFADIKPTVFNPLHGGAEVVTQSRQPTDTMNRVAEFDIVAVDLFEPGG